ncbi:MAG: T9SS type A sorting domain-containing protein, partial [Candidatus Marinimicrobia bacterium]|nr:T9SS type A sorting domain-containing protein [Candidatus Neomarinimicrobiota bacterium]
AVYGRHRLAELPTVYHDFWQVVNSDCGLKSIFGLGDCNEYIDGPSLYNAMPLAHAGANQVVGFLEQVVLDGSESFDADGTITSSLWTQIQGQTVNLENEGALSTSFTSSNQNETLMFELSIADNEGGTSRDTTTIMVSSSSAMSGSDTPQAVDFSISPNPFNGSTMISWLPSALDQHITIYDLRGRIVFYLSQAYGAQHGASIRWDGHDQQGTDLQAGVYLIHYQSGNNQAIRKVTYLK